MIVALPPVARPVWAATIAVSALLGAPCRAQVPTLVPRGAGEYWLHAGFGVAGTSGAYGDFLRHVVAADMSLLKGTGPWRFGGGLRYGSQKMRAPYRDQLEWTRVGVFGSAMRVFGAEGSVRPFVELRPEFTRMHTRALLFQNVDSATLAEGGNPTPSHDGAALTLRSGVEVDVRSGFSFDLAGAVTGFRTGEYDLTPIGLPGADSGLEWGVHAGFTWRPLATRESVGPQVGDPWGVPPSWGWAVGEMLGVNLVATTIDEFLRGESSYPVSPHSALANLRNGWAFDDNDFATNQFWHPLNGATYYNSARANGIGFWGSSLVAMLGAFMWECCGETQPMSWNDMMSTGIGGITRGEATYRGSSLILDNTATGWGRFWREAGAAFINPLRGINRLASGRMTHVGQNPSDPFEWRPPLVDVEVNLGARGRSEGHSIRSDVAYHAFADFELLYGNPFENQRRRPWDRFDVYAEGNIGDKTLVGQLRIRSDLWSKTLGGEPGPEINHAIAFTQDFDYVDNNAYEFGGQSFGFAYYSRHGSPATRLTLRMVAHWIVGAAVSSDYAELADVPDPRQYRDYDYGFGPEAGLDALLVRRGRSLMRLTFRSSYVIVENGSVFHPENSLLLGSDSRHTVHRGDLRLVLPLGDRYGLGVGSAVFYRKSHYDGDEVDGAPVVDERRWSPEVRIYLSRSWR